MKELIFLQCGPHLHRGGFGYSMGRLLDLTELALTQPSNWAKEAYLEEFRKTFSTSGSGPSAIRFLGEEEGLRFVRLLDEIPDFDEVRRVNQAEIDRILKTQQSPDSQPVGK